MAAAPAVLKGERYRCRKQVGRCLKTIGIGSRSIRHFLPPNRSGVARGAIRGTDISTDLAARLDPGAAARCP